MEKLRELSVIAVAQKAQLLSVKEGGYSPVQHDLYRTGLPDMKRKYGGQNARDALILLAYLHAYTNGQSANDCYMWAYPTNERICADTGIHRDRLRPLKDILVGERLLIVEKIGWRGNQKDMYLPLYFPTESRKQDTAKSYTQHTAESRL